MDKIAAGIVNSGNEYPRSPASQRMAGDAGAGKTPWKHNKNESLDDGDPVALLCIREILLKTLGFQ